MKSYETQDFEIRKPLHAIAAGAVCLITVFAIVYGVLHGVKRVQSGTLQASRDPGRAVPAPLLQTNVSIRSDIAKVKAEEVRFYNRSKVEVRPDGYYKIPLQYAKEHVLRTYGGSQ